MYCSKCNMNISDDSIFCYRCGTKVTDMDFDESDNSISKNTCSNCGNEISDDSKFCYKCGTKVADMDFDELDNSTNNTTCSNCGSEISDDSIFCYRCGTNTGIINFNETSGCTTENNNAQINDVSKVDNISNRNIDLKKFDLTNVNINEKINPKQKNHKFLWMCIIAVIILIASIKDLSIIGIVVIMFVVKKIISGYGETKSTNKNNTTTYNVIELPNTYTNKDEGICFNYPKNWKNDPSLKSKHKAIVFFRGKVGLKTYSLMFINKLNKGNDGFDLFYARSELEEHWVKSNIEIKETIHTTIDGIDAIKMTGITLDDKFKDTTVVAYIYIIDEIYYEVLFNSRYNTFDKYSPIFNKIMESYKITTPTKNSPRNNTITYNVIELPNTYTNEDEGIFFNYPKNWKDDPSLVSKHKSMVCLKGKVGQKNYSFMFVFKVNKGNDGFDLFNAKSNMEKRWVKQNIEIQEIIDTEIDGVDAIKMTGITLDDKFNNTTVVAYMYIIDGIYYEVLFDSIHNTFDKHGPIFDKIMESYKITTPTGNTLQKPNTDDYGLSKEEALEAAQQFLDTHPLLRHTITGVVDYEPQVKSWSTKGLYRIETKALDGSLREMWVDKRTGFIFLSADSTTLRDGEKVYQEVFVSNQENDEILFGGIKVSEYLDSSTKSIYDKFGPDKYGSDVGGSLYENYKYIGYDGISFLYDDSSNIQRICGNPEMFTYNGVTLNKNCDELVELFGVPSAEDSIYNNTTRMTVSWIEYSNDNYTIRFEFGSEDGDANLIEIY